MLGQPGSAPRDGRRTLDSSCPVTSQGLDYPAGHSGSAGPPSHAPPARRREGREGSLQLLNIPPTSTQFPPQPQTTALEKFNPLLAKARTLSGDTGAGEAASPEPPPGAPPPGGACARPYRPLEPRSLSSFCATEAMTERRHRLQGASGRAFPWTLAPTALGHC